VLFDFDGTLSLIREGWPAIMIPMMVDVLQQTPTRETSEELTAVARRFRHATQWSADHLSDDAASRGGSQTRRYAAGPLDYKHQYHDLLMQRIHSRLEDLQGGKVTAESWTVPGSHGLLDWLRNRGVKLYLASGTDLKYVRHEAALLGIAAYFGEHIYGALDEHQNFSKAMIVERILREEGLRGEELLGFGDGFVEIQEIRKVGGVAVAVASDEQRRAGVNTWKRDRLVHAGADVVIPEYRKAEKLLNWLFDGVVG
jgi:phosphoglycolate phosphatase-like HAD superfamily hydrolase